MFHSCLISCKSWPVIVQDRFAHGRFAVYRSFCIYVETLGAESDNLIPYYCRYCYLLEDLTPELLAEKCPTYDSLGEYLRMRGREAYIEKKVMQVFHFL